MSTNDMKADAGHLVELYDQRVQLTHRNARADRLTSDMVLEVLGVGDQLDEACERFRRRYYPRRQRVAVGLWQVFVTYRTGHQSVLDLFEQYRPTVEHEHVP